MPKLRMAPLNPQAPVLSESRPQPRPERRILSLLNRSLIATTLLAALIVAAAFWLGARNRSDDQWVRHSLEVRGN